MPSILNSWAHAVPPQTRRPANQQLNHPLSLDSRGLGAAARGAGDLHVVSDQFNNRRADALILYVRRVAYARNATAAQLLGEPAGRTVSGYEVLDPGMVLVVFGLGAVGQHDRSAGEP